MSNKQLAILGLSVGTLVILAAILMGFLGFPHAGFGFRKIALAILGLLVLIPGVILLFQANNSSKGVWVFFVRVLRNVWKEGYLIPNILVSMAVLALYCRIFVYLSPKYLDLGTNYHFSNKLYQVSIVLLAGVYLIYFLIYKLRKSTEVTFKFSFESLSFSDALLLLFPLTPVVQYILNNQDILSPVGSLSLVALFAFFSGIYIFTIPLLLGIISSARTLMILGLSFVFTLTNMALLSHYFSWYETGDFIIQLIFFGGVFIVSWLLYNYRKKVLYLLVAVLFFANTGFQVVANGIGSNVPSFPSSENKLPSLVDGKKPAATPNVYLLVYDAYVANETMLAYGINNGSQEDYLSEQGFTLYPYTYSIGATTVDTMSRVLNASTNFYGDPRVGVSGDGIVQNIFRSLGYETYGVFPSDYEFRGIRPSYDYIFPNYSQPYLLLAKAILTGEFRFDIEYFDPTHEQYVEAKRDVFNSISGNSAFIYTHSNLPAHSQNSGVCRADEIEQFNDRLVRANLEMRQDIDLITQKDPGAIVIIAGDHGPYLTKNCYETQGYDISEITRLDIQDRYGTFLAIRWPTGDYARYDDITVLQDLFPSIFAYLFKDTKISEAKVPPETLWTVTTSGATVVDGIIHGGVNDGEPLFLSGQ